jgi:hypothetical protein
VNAIAASCSRLTTFDIASSFVTSMSIQRLASRCPSLQQLVLAECTNINDLALTAIAEHCLNLRVLDVAECKNLTDASVISVVTKCTKLQEMNVSKCHMLTDAFINAIDGPAGVNLTELWTRSCGRVRGAAIIHLQERRPALIVHR